MISNLYFCILSSFYSVLLLFTCLKNKKNNLEYKIFRKLVLTNFIGIILGFICFYTVMNYNSIPIFNYIISRIYLVYLFVWVLLFTLYTITISYNIKEKDRIFNTLKKIAVILTIIFAILIFYLPLNYVSEKNAVYSYGGAAQLVYVISEVFTLISIFCMFKNSKKIDIKKYSPLFIYIVCGIIVMLIQSIHPELLLMTSMEIFSTYIIYFTIEGKNDK